VNKKSLEQIDRQAQSGDCQTITKQEEMGRGENKFAAQERPNRSQLAALDWMGYTE